MSLPFYYRLIGYLQLSTDAAHAAALLDICRRKGLPYAAFTHISEGDGGIALTFTLPNARTLLAAAEACAIPVAVGRAGGLPRRLLSFFRRPGLVVGMVLGVLLCMAASHVVWDIRISGNQTVSDRAIEESLAACGFSVGTPLRGFHADVLENQVLLLDDRLAWISVNRRGTVAYVEVREAIRSPASSPDRPADIVAATAGIIERVELETGNVRVSAGQFVSPGEVLVSGLYDSDRYGIRFTRASACVYARTVHEFTITIPLTYEQTVYETGPDGTLDTACQEKFLNFFGKSIKFSKKTGNEGGSCDTIEREQKLIPISSVGFPISVRTVWYLPYTVTTLTRTHAEAEELAYVELARRIAALPGGAEILGKTVTTQRGKDCFVLRCTLTCVEDIGTIREIEIVH